MKDNDFEDEQLATGMEAEDGSCFDGASAESDNALLAEMDRIPNKLDASGLYVNRMRGSKEEFRLDIDGHYPQMEASGTLAIGLKTQINWIARLTAQGQNRFSGAIWYKDGNALAFPYTTINITIRRNRFMQRRFIRVTFTGGGAPSRFRMYRYQSRYFHAVELEFDRVSDVAANDAVTSINTCAHPNRPPSLPCENLTINTVFQRAGFDVKTSAGNGSIPIDAAGANSTWSNTEMHDAMQSYWSRYANRPQWAMWVLFANLHDSGTGLGGIMFDDIGPNHRQGTAVFENAFISQAPAGDAAPIDWVSRMRFWTACHEMGHGFNLAHSWQKEMGTSWTPIANEREARSFMNYPYYVSGGQTAFFADFENRFSDSELLFMRHAPNRFVQMGNADWFDNHGFEQASPIEPNQLNLLLRANRPTAQYDFLEPVILEMKLTNTTAGPLLLEENILTSSHNITVVIKQNGKPAREWTPFVRYLRQSQKRVLYPGESIYESLFASVGLNGWDISEPGQYSVQMLLNVDGADVISNPISLRVLPANSFDAECCAQDIFTEDVGRILTMNGSKELTTGNDMLQDLIDRLPNSQAAKHARVALAVPQTRDYKTLADKDGEIIINTAIANVDEAQTILDSALLTDSDTIAQTLGHIAYKKLMDNSVRFLMDKGNTSAAKHYAEHSYNTLSSRGVPDWVFEGQAITKATSKIKPKSKKTTEDIA